MTDDLATLIVQTGGQLTGLIIKSAIVNIPGTMNAGLSLMGTMANPILWIMPYFILSGLPVLGTMLAIGIIK